MIAVDHRTPTPPRRPRSPAARSAPRRVGVSLRRRRPRRRAGAGRPGARRARAARRARQQRRGGHERPVRRHDHRRLALDPRRQPRRRRPRLPGVRPGHAGQGPRPRRQRVVRASATRCGPPSRPTSPPRRRCWRCRSACGPTGRSSGVGVSAVCPGVINTPILDATRFLGAQAETARAHPHGVPPGPPARAGGPRRGRSPSARTRRSCLWGGRPSSAGGPTACCPSPSSSASPGRRCEPATRANRDPPPGPVRPDSDLPCPTAPSSSSPPTTAPSWRSPSPASPAATCRPVVLPHCWTGLAGRRVPVARRLLAAGHRVVLYDQRGHGASTVGRQPVSIARLGDDLAAVLEQLDLRDVVLAGHSMGGMTVMAFACGHPEVVRERVRGLALVATAAHGLATPAAASGSGACVLWRDLVDRAMARPGLGRAARARHVRRATRGAPTSRRRGRCSSPPGRTSGADAWRRWGDGPAGRAASRGRPGRGRARPPRHADRQRADPGDRRTRRRRRAGRAAAAPVTCCRSSAPTRWPPPSAGSCRRLRLLRRPTRT